MIREAHLADFVYVACILRDEEKRQYQAYGWAPGFDPQRLAVWRWEHSTYSFVFASKDGVIYAIAGAYITNGVAHIWFMPTPKIEEMPIGITREILRFAKRGFQIVLQNGVCHRVEASVVGGDPGHVKFAESAGLVFEGIRKRAGANREDIYVFAKTE